MKTAPKIAALSLAAITMSFPTLGDEAAPARTPWKKVDLQTREEAVRWVVEGCAAYPVMAEATEENDVAQSSPASNADLPEVHVAKDIDRLDRSETQ